MKRVKIKRRARFFITALLILMLTASVTGLFWFYRSPLETAEEISVFSYKQEANVEYEVNYRANQFVPTIPKASKIAYITDLTDHISTTFSYRFSGQSKASIEGVYSVHATVTAYTGTERNVVWERNFVLLEPTDFTSQDRDLVIQEKVRIPFGQYVDFANKVAEEIKFSPDDLELTVKYHAAIKAETDSGTVMEEAAPAMVIPLKGRVYTIGGNLTVNKEDGIKQTKMVPIPFVKEKRLGFTIAAGTFAILLLSFLLWTVPKEKELSPLEKTIRRILKKHGERIIICQSDTEALASDRIIEVKTFEDLVKTADELGKPILYNELQRKDGQAFVVFADNTYVYNVRPYLATWRGRKKALVQSKGEKIC